MVYMYKTDRTGHSRRDSSNSNIISIMKCLCSLFTVVMVAMFRISQGSAEAGWEVVRPLGKSIFQINSAGKSSIGECFSFNATIEAPRNTTRVNKDSQWTLISGESTQTPTYELVIDNTSRHCLAAQDTLASGSESINMVWTYAIDGFLQKEENLQTVFPFNNCKVKILRQESDTEVSFKAFIKSCSGNYLFWPRIGIFSRQEWYMVFDRKYVTYEKRAIVSTAGELHGTTSMAIHFDKVALRRDNMSLKAFTFRLELDQAGWEVVDVLWVIDLLPVF